MIDHNSHKHFARLTLATRAGLAGATEVPHVPTATLIFPFVIGAAMSAMLNTVTHVHGVIFFVGNSAIGARLVSFIILPSATKTFTIAIADQHFLPCIYHHHQKRLR